MARALALPIFSPRWWLAHPLYLAAAAVALVVALTATWYLASPLFIRTQLVEGGAVTGQVIAHGSFSDRDIVHRGSGTVRLVRAPDGRTHLQLDQFRVTNGPDLFVYLTPVAAPNSHDDVVRDALQVGRLKASEGAFGYELPPGADISKLRAAVIYCYQFRTIFSVAPLSAG